MYFSTGNLNAKSDDDYLKNGFKKWTGDWYVPQTVEGFEMTKHKYTNHVRKNWMMYLLGFIIIALIAYFLFRYKYGYNRNTSESQ